MSSRRWAGPLRGMSDHASLTRHLLGHLGAVAASGLLAVLHAGCVERAADDLVAHTRQVAHTATTHEHDRVLLQVVALAGDVGGDLDTTRQTNSGDLAQRGVRLLGGVRVDPGAHTTTLRRTLEGRRLGL